MSSSPKPKIQPHTLESLQGSEIPPHCRPKIRQVRDPKIVQLLSTSRAASFSRSGIFVDSLTGSVKTTSISTTETAPMANIKYERPEYFSLELDAGL